MNTDAVILAGGYSSRANAFKMELELNGKPILQHVIDAFSPVCIRIIVVGGYQMERLAPLVSKYEEKVTAVYNPDYSKGMFTSVKKGIAEVTGSQFFLTPGDFPLITTDICKRILEHRGQIVKPQFHNRGGHPILLPYDCINEILAEEDDSNLKLYLDKKQVLQIEIEDESIVLDVDTPADYEKVKQLKQQGLYVQSDAKNLAWKFENQIMCGTGVRQDGFWNCEWKGLY
ncbi:MAG: nucleotidyltransferase family protein [Anaerocolumna sp.]